VADTKPISPSYLDMPTMRASAVLPGAGAFDASPLEVPCQDFKFVTLYITYTRGGAGGAVTLRIEVSPDTSGNTWYRSGLYEPAAVASGSDATSELQREFIKYGSTAAGAEYVVFGPLVLQGGIQRMRIACAESGAVGTPGTCAIRALFS